MVLGMSCVAGFFLATVSCSAILGDFGVSATSTPDATTNPETGALPDGTAPLDAAPDGALICPKNSADCDSDPENGCEVSLTQSASCGACNHACGGTASCVDGKCTPELLSMTLDHPFGFAIAGSRALWMGPDAVWGCGLANCSTSTAIMVDITSTTNNPNPNGQFSPRQIVVDGTTFYYDKCPGVSDCTPAACPITGCKSGGAINGSTDLVTSSGLRRSQMLVGGPSSLYTWQGIDRLIRFSLPTPTTTTNPGPYFIGDYLGAMHIDAQNFVYIDDNASLANPTGGLYVCPVAGCAAKPQTLLAPPLRLLGFGGDGIAITSTGGANQSAAAIIACGVGGCGGTGVNLATNQAYPSDIVADDKDVYWSTIGSAAVAMNTAPVGTIMRCSLPACAGGPEKIADQVVNPVGIALDADYVYWVTYGTGAMKNGTLVRRRR